MQDLTTDRDWDNFLAATRGKHARPVYDLDAIEEDPAFATEPECCS